MGEQRASSEIGSALGLPEDAVEAVRRIEARTAAYNANAERVLGSLYGAHTQREAASAFKDAARKQRLLTFALVIFTTVQGAGIIAQLVSAR